MSAKFSCRDISIEKNIVQINKSNKIVQTSTRERIDWRMDMRVESTTRLPCYIGQLIGLALERCIFTFNYLLLSFNLLQKVLTCYLMMVAYKDISRVGVVKRFQFNT